MEGVWMLDYLNAVFPRWGVFETEGAAWKWVTENDPERRSYYTAFYLPINRLYSTNVQDTAPHRVYRNF